MDNGMKFCRHCNKETYYEREVMSEGHPHYAKRICGECHRFIDWMKKPRETRSKKEAARVIVLKKQAVDILTEEFLAKYSKLVIEIFELEVDFQYVTDNDFWQDDLHVVS